MAAGVKGIRTNPAAHEQFPDFRVRAVAADRLRLNSSCSLDTPWPGAHYPCAFLRKHLRHPCATPESGGARHKRTKIRGILAFAICSFVPALAFVSKSCAQVIEPPQARVSTAAELQNAVTAAASSKLRCIRCRFLLCPTLALCFYDDLSAGGDHGSLLPGRRRCERIGFSWPSSTLW